MTDTQPQEYSIRPSGSKPGEWNAYSSLNNSEVGIGSNPHAAMYDLIDILASAKPAPPAWAYSAAKEACGPGLLERQYIAKAHVIAEAARLAAI